MDNVHTLERKEYGIIILQSQNGVSNGDGRSHKTTHSDMLRHSHPERDSNS